MENMIAFSQNNFIFVYNKHIYKTMEESKPTWSTHLSMMGNDSLLGRCTACFLCSHKVPDAAFPAIRRWVHSLSPERDCIMIGCLAGMERFVLRLLVERGISVVLILAEALPKEIEHVSVMVPDIVLSTAMGEGKLLVISANNEEEATCATKENAALRNQWMMDYTQHTVIGYVNRNGRLYQQLLGRCGVTVLCPPED